MKNSGVKCFEGQILETNISAFKQKYEYSKNKNKLENMMLESGINSKHLVNIFYCS